MDYKIFVDNKPDPEHHYKTYCGPTVLMLLSGHSRKKIHSDINRAKNKAGQRRYREYKNGNGGYKIMKYKSTHRVTGLSNSALEKLMEKYGLKPKKSKTKPGMTVSTFAKDMEFVQYPIVISTMHHYVILFRGIVYDTYRRDGSPAAEHPCATGHVKTYWEIQKRWKS